VAEGWWAPYSADRPHLLYSLSKSFTSTAAAFAAAEGLLDLDDTVVSHFPELEADITDPGSRSMRIRHIAAMASGQVKRSAQIWPAPACQIVPTRSQGAQGTGRLAVWAKVPTT